MNKISNKCFDDFVTNVSANDSETDAIISSHKNVNKKLNDSDFNPMIRKVILVGSYRRGTNTKTIIDDDKKIDVDVAVIFKYNSYEKPQIILDKLFSYLNNLNEYKDKVVRQKRSIGIKLSKTHVDVVPFQEFTNNQDDPLYISSINKQYWEKTHPVGHINYFSDIKAEKHNFNYFVKSIKWWKKHNKPSHVKYPNGIAIETMVSKYYVDNTNKFEGLLSTLINIEDNVQLNYLADPLDSSNNLFAKMTDDHFKDFKNKLKNSINTIREGLDGLDIEKIRKVFSDEFPKKCEIIEEDDLNKLKKATQGTINFSSDK